MSPVLVILLTTLFAFACAFAASFTAVTLYIEWHRYTPSKYHFVGTAEMPTWSGGVHSADQATVDNDNAMKTWQSGSGKDQF